MTTAGSWVWTWTLIAASSPTTSADSPCRRISARTSSNARSLPLMMNSVQYPQPIVGASITFGRACWVAGRSKVASASPVMRLRKPSRMSCSPKPPASITPACLRIGSWSGVRSTASAAATQAARATSVVWGGCAALASVPPSRLSGSRQHGALGRLDHRPVGHIGANAKGVGQSPGVDRAFRANANTEAAEDLREDDTGIAPRSHQGTMTGALRHQRKVGVVEVADLVDRRLQGEEHVGPGIPIGNGEDVERVDLVAVNRQPGQRAEQGLFEKTAVAFDDGPCRGDGRALDLRCRRSH